MLACTQPHYWVRRYCIYICWIDKWCGAANVSFSTRWRGNSDFGHGKPAAAQPNTTGTPDLFTAGPTRVRPPASRDPPLVSSPPHAQSPTPSISPSPLPLPSGLLLLKQARREEEEASQPSSIAGTIFPDHGSRFHPDALPLPRPACPHRQVPLPQPRAARPPAPPRQVRPRRLHEICRRRSCRRRRRQERRRRPGRQGRRRRREQRQRVQHGRVLPPRAARGPRESAAAAQLRHVPARGGARPGGRRGPLRAGAAGLARRRRPAQPLRPRHLGGAPGEGPRRGVLRARRAGSARRLLRARIVRELPVGRRGGGSGTGRSPERRNGGACLPGAGARVLS